MQSSLAVHLPESSFDFYTPRPDVTTIRDAIKPEMQRLFRRAFNRSRLEHSELLAMEAR
jgi:hypothetical protein